MKLLSLLICGAFLATAAPSFAEPAPSPNPSASAKAQKYTCPMHPDVVENKPGNCPKCGMKLVEKKDKKGDKK